MNEIESMKIQNAVLKTISYFDIFEYPLTLFEIWQYLLLRNERHSEITLHEVFKTIQNIPENKLQRCHEFYFLPGRDGNIIKRKKRNKLAIKKYKKVGKYLRLLSNFPFIEMICVCNSLSINNSREDSDIDIFVISKNEKIWTSRFLVSFFLKIFRLRPTEKTTKDRICPSFFITRDNLNLEKYQIDECDYYLIYWVATVLPVYYNRKVRKRFYKENSWIKNFIPNIIYNSPVKERTVTLTFIECKVKYLFEYFFKSKKIEQALKKIQLKNFPISIKNNMNVNSNIVVNDRILKFHSVDRREEYNKLFQERIKNYCL